MARLRIETAPEITVYDESFVIKAAAGASAPLAEFKNSAGTVVGNIAVDGTLNVLSVVTSNAGTTSTSLATRGYVDTVAAGLNWHDSVAFATAAALSACTYANGTLGVGATLTGNANGRLTVDGSAQTTGKSILVKDQATATQHGIYTITEQGSVSTPFVLTRRTDSNNSVPGQVSTGDSVYVVSGTNNGGQGFTLTTTGTGTNGAIIFGTDSLTFAQFTGTATFTAGAGLTSTGNVLDVATASSSRIVINADSIDLATVSQSNTSGSNTTTFVSSFTVDSYGRISGKETSSVSFAGYATLASPALTGTPTAPTAAADTNTTQVATTAFVVGQAYAKIASPTFTGTVTIPTGAAITLPTVSSGINHAGSTSGTTKLQASAVASGTITLPAVTGTVITTGDTGTVTSTMITDGTIVDGDINASAAIAQSKISGLSTSLGLKADLASPTFTGTVTIPAGASISGFAPLASPALTGVPTAPTAANTVSNTQIATTAYVKTVIADLVSTAPATLDTLGEIATSLANNASLSSTLTSSIALKAPLADPTFTGTVTLPTGTVTSAMILDGTIVNADISASAAIDQGKIADTTLNAQTASYTLVLTDKNKLVEISNASANTLTVPPNSSVAFPVGSTLTVLQTGAGQCTITAGAGVTVNGTPGLKLRTTWSSATLIKRATDTWVALGDMVA